MPVSVSKTKLPYSEGNLGDIKEKKTKRSLVNGLGIRPPLVWNKKIPNTELDKFKKVVEEKFKLHFDSYWDFHKWSVENYANFWEEIWNYFGVITSKPYDKVVVKTGDGFLDNEWFTGALFNYAENILRIRDDRVALIYIEENGYEEVVTFAQVFEEVKLYAAAFRKHGLQKGDRVACYMSNRKEALFTMLAATSIGAIFSGPQPYYGARASANIINKMEPKFLIIVDHHIDNGTDFNLLENTTVIANSCSTLEKIIVIPTREETLADGISHIRNSCFLEQFLDVGRNPDGSIPDIVFEQLPFNHPICINFTSGTTGLPKGPVHSAGTLITHLENIAFHYNLTSGDVTMAPYAVGWSLWDSLIPCLALGIKMLLYCGSPYITKEGMNIWDVIARYKVKYAFLVTSIVDKLEKLQIVPSQNSNLDHFKTLFIGGCPAKIQNFLYIQNRIKKDLFIGSQYGATETFGTFSGFDYNLPAYAGEVQAFALGMDIRIVDSNGRSVIGERGELVVATPTPSFPICLWKDVDNTIMKNTFLSKYPGVWCQNDECWINPETRGLVVIGRSDDTLIQNGERFGAADVYFAIHEMEEIMDYICVNQGRSDGECRAVLFVKLKPGYEFTSDLRKKIARTIDRELWEDCVPQVILEVPDIPYNLNNKRMESVVRKIVATNQIPQVNNIRNPESLKYFCNIPELLSYEI
ncbi:Acetoacetyl-CoA synthetase, partial [Stegodyphus mimosarum]